MTDDSSDTVKISKEELSDLLKEELSDLLNEKFVALEKKFEAQEKKLDSLDLKYQFAEMTEQLDIAVRRAKKEIRESADDMDFNDNSYSSVFADKAYGQPMSIPTGRDLRENTHPANDRNSYMNFGPLGWL